MYQAKSGAKNFSLYRGGGGRGRGGPSTKNFFPSLNMYQAKSGVKNVSFTRGGVPKQNFFSPVWTCMKPNLVSKIFPFTRGGSPRQKNFSSLNMYQAKSGVKNFSLYWDRVPPPLKIWDLGPPQKIWDLGPPWKSETWDPPHENLRPGTSLPTWTWTWDPPPKVWTDTQTGVKTLPSLVLRTGAVMILSDHGGCRSRSSLFT